VQEETGVAREVVDCRRVRHDVAVRAGTGDDIYMLWVVFVARDAGGTIDVQESEPNGAAWFHEPPEPLKESVADDPWWWEEWE
jgi:hypothetical protein